MLDTRPRNYLDERGIGYDNVFGAQSRVDLRPHQPLRRHGPWADYPPSDLVHLALGGIMMNCGYDPDPSGFYETPPVAPQIWQSYHIAGEMTRSWSSWARWSTGCHTGHGQRLTTTCTTRSAKNTETDLPDWVYCLAQPH